MPEHSSGFFYEKPSNETSDFFTSVKNRRLNYLTCFWCLRDFLAFGIWYFAPSWRSGLVNVFSMVKLDKIIDNQRIGSSAPGFLDRLQSSKLQKKIRKTKTTKKSITKNQNTMQIMRPVWAHLSNRFKHYDINDKCMELTISNLKNLTSNTMNHQISKT